MPLPVPEHLKKAQDEELPAGDYGVKKLIFVEVNSKQYKTEYTFKRDNAVVHIYSKDDIFPMGFGRRLQHAFSAWPGAARVLVDWVDELQSWCVVVVDGARTRPTETDIERIIRNVIGS